jgi:ABC-2 type transport system permease protein
VSTQPNVVSESSLGSQGVAIAAMPLLRLMWWSLRRELWENRAIYVAPLAAAAVFLFGFSIGSILMLAGIHGAPWLDLTQQTETLGQPYEVAEDLIIATAVLVAMFYSVDALYGERRDRSILFWKSLPVSDLTTVLAKASIPILILPLLASVLAIMTESMMIFMSSAAMLISGHGAGALWARVPLFQMWLKLVFHFFCIHGLWQSPIYGWLLLVSAWARRTPILWALLPPVAIGFGEKIAFNTTYFGDLIGSRFTGGSEGVAVMGHHAWTASLNLLVPAHFLINPGLWMGFAFTAICLAAAARVRRYRGPI